MTLLQFDRRCCISIELHDWLDAAKVVNGWIWGKQRTSAIEDDVGIARAGVHSLNGVAFDRQAGYPCFVRCSHCLCC